MLTSAACPVGRNSLKPHQTDVIPLGEQGGRTLVGDPASSLSLVCSELVGVCVWIMGYMGPRVLASHNTLLCSRAQAYLGTGCGCSKPRDK